MRRFPPKESFGARLRRNQAAMRAQSPTGEAPPLPASMQHLAKHLEPRPTVAAHRMRVVKKRDGLSELQHQIRVVTWWDKRCGDWGLPSIALLAIPNGGSRGSIEAANMKRSGTRPGAEDLMLAVPRNGSHGLFIEMKLQTGHISDEQKAMAEFHFAQGYQSYIAYSNEQAIEIITDYLTPEL